MRRGRVAFEVVVDAVDAVDAVGVTLESSHERGTAEVSRVLR